jgi:alpha-L-fucosidase
MTEGAAWFDDARFGMFVHWSHASLNGWELSWPLVTDGFEAIPNAKATPVDEWYGRAREFDPQPGAAKEWTELARDAGMRYVILTTKHHDGFALWPSAHVRGFHASRDLVAEFVDAARTAELRVGFYLSLSDWHHPDYPAFTDDDRPYMRYLGRRPPAEAWARYRNDLFGQVRELLTNYGDVSVMWFDGQWERTVDEWDAPALRALIRDLQPDCLVNDRLPGQGDYTTPEQLVPAVAPAGRWETCLTMNRSWGYVPGDHEYKSARDIVHALCETAGKGGNLL